MENKFNIKQSEDEIFRGPTNEELKNIEDELSTILDYIKVQNESSCHYSE